MGKLKSSNLSKVYLNHVMIKMIKKICRCWWNVAQ